MVLLLLPCLCCAQFLSCCLCTLFPNCYYCVPICGPFPLLCNIYCAFILSSVSSLFCSLSSHLGPTPLIGASIAVVFDELGLPICLCISYFLLLWLLLPLSLNKLHSCHSNVVAAALQQCCFCFSLWRSSLSRRCCFSKAERTRV